MPMTTEGPVHQDALAHALSGATAKEVREHVSRMNSSAQLRHADRVFTATLGKWEKEVHIVNGTALNPPLLSREQATAGRDAVWEHLAAVEKRERAERDEAEREATRQAEQRRAAALEATAKAARAAELHTAERDRARAELRELVAHSPIGIILQSEVALREAAWDGSRALSGAGSEQEQRELLEALEVDATALRRALNMLPGYHHAALNVPQSGQPDIVDALLALPSIMNALSVIGERVAQLELRRNA